MTITALLPMTEMQKEAPKTYILPSLKINSLMSVKSLAENGYIIFFYPPQESVTIHVQGGVKVTFRKNVLLQGWRKKRGT